jgi:DoxX
MNVLSDIFNNPGIGFIFVKMLIPAFMAILFVQSGLDKVFDYKGNLAYFTDHFKSSPLASTVGLLMPIITLMEVAAGILCLIGTIALASGNTKWAFWGLMVAALSFLSLFFGQRVAKDYAGALTIVTYFVLNVLGLLLLV